MSELPAVTFVIPVYNAAGTLTRCVRSAVRQRGLAKRIVLVDHASTDGSTTLAGELAGRFDEVELVPLSRLPSDRRSPSRPLNVGIAEALKHHSGQRDRSWVLRLDSDDVLAHDDVVAEQLEAGGYRQLVMATLVFFDERAATAYEYGPRLNHRTLAGLPGRDVYAVAHHSTAMRADLLAGLAGEAAPYDETLETGEDLGVTCQLIRALGGDQSRFAFVANPYCYKALDDGTITSSLPLRRVWRSHRKLVRDHPELATFAVLRGLAEAALTRVIGEGPARRCLQHLAGRNGHYRAVDFELVAERVRQLRDPSASSAA
jgi:glycosyltransferase involved in cell wall biosynthesis